MFNFFQGYLICEALLPGPFSGAKNVACKARNATMMPKEKLEWQLQLLWDNEALIAVSQAGKATMDAKREDSTASKIAAIQPHKSTIEAASIAVNQTAKKLHSFALTIARIV